MSLVKNSKVVVRKDGKTIRTYLDKTRTEKEALISGFESNHILARRLLEGRYDNKCVIRKIDVSRKGRVQKIYMGTTSNCPMIDITKPDENFVKTIPVANANNDTTYRVAIDGVKSSYKYYPDVIQVTYKSNSDQLEMTRKGAWFKEGERVKYTAPLDTEGWIHVPGASVWGPSNEKAGNKFFFSDRLENDQWWDLIDGLTGFSYKYYLKDKREAKKILKNTSRLNMFGTTMEKFGEIDLRKYRVVIADCNFDAISDVDKETAERLGHYGIDFDVCINDGKDYILADFLAETLHITAEEACMLAVQNRANYVQTKCLCQNLLEDQMEMVYQNTVELYGKENINVYGNPDGPIALIADDNAAKLVNVEALESGNIIIDVYGLAIAKASNSRTSGQLIAKLLEKNYEEAIKRLSELTTEAFNDLYADKILNSKFNPKTGINNNTAAVLGELAVNDEGFMWSTLHDMTTFAKSALADMKINLNSVYNHAMFDDCYVQSRGMVDHILTTKDCGEYGELIEVFSLDTIVYFADEIEEIENSAMTEEQKETQLDELLSAFIIKYPSAGAEEFLGVRYLTLKEWRKRVAKALDKMEDADENLVEHFKQYCNQIPYGVTLFAGFNFIKNKLAGMDVDFDATLAIFDEIKTILLNKDAENVLTFIDYEDNSKADYSEITTKLEVAELNFAK